MAVGTPGDKFEQEADRVAEQVARMPAALSTRGDTLQRQMDDKDKMKGEEKIRKAPAPEGNIQGKEGGDAPALRAGTQSAIESKMAGGQPFGSDIRREMESRFGADLGKVRIHNDVESAGISRQLGARAFTFRHHIFFARDQYHPGSADGKQLLAHELTHTIQQGYVEQRLTQAQRSAPRGGSTPAVQKKASHGPATDDAALSSEVVDVSSNVFSPSEKVKAEIEAQGRKGLLMRVIVKGVTGEGLIKIRVDSSKNYESIGSGSMPVLNAWAKQLGGMYLQFSVRNSEITGGYASLKERGGDRNDWLQYVQKNSALLGGLGLKIDNLPKPVNTFENGKLTLGVTNMKVEVGGFVDALFNVSLENAGKPKIDASANVNIKGIVQGQLHLDNSQEKLTGEISLGINHKAFNGTATVKYLADGTVDVSGKAAYNSNKLSGEITFVATDADSANNFAKDAIAAAGGKENVQNAALPGPVPAPKPGKKQRSLAATGQLGFNLTTWFAGSVFVVVDGKGEVTVIGKIAPPKEIELFKQRDWDKELVKFEAKAYYGIPVVGNLNLFANISLHALASLGPAKIYNIEILGTYSTDPTIQKSIQISGSINISAYAGLRLRAEGGAGIEIVSHDLKFGIGLDADIGVKAYADARPTIGFREPGEFYISGTLEMVAQPMLGLGGDFFIKLEAPWWSPLSDDKWTWPLFKKEWPLSDPIGLNAVIKEYTLGSGKTPEVELKKPEFDPSKFMTNMVDRTLPDKSGEQRPGQGTFKEDGTVPKPVVPPKKEAPKKADAKAGVKKDAPPKVGKSAAPDPKAGKEQEHGKVFQKAAKALSALKGKGPLTQVGLTQELAKIKAQVRGIDFDVQHKELKWVVTPKAGGKTGKGLEIDAKGPGPTSKKGVASAFDPTPVTVKIQFTMISTSHTLTTTATENAVHVTMASNGGELGKKISALIKAVDDRKNQIRKKERVKNQLTKIKDKLNDYNQLKTAYARSLKEEYTQRPVPPEFVRHYSNELVGQIVDLATRYQFRDLVAQTFLPDPLPEKRFIPEPVKSKIRNLLYERQSAWDRVRDTEVRNGIASIDNEVNATIIIPRDAGKAARTAKEKKAHMSAAKTAMADMKKRGKVLEGATLEHFAARHSYVTPNLKQYAVDHDPSLAEHWVKHDGNKTSDSVRKDIVEGKSKLVTLDLVTRRFNSQKGSRDLTGEAHRFKAHAWITPPFTSAIGKDVNGKADNVDVVSIDDHSLTHEDGTPFLPS